MSADRQGVIKMRQSRRLDVEGEHECTRGTHLWRVGMRFPRIHHDHGLVGKGIDLAIDLEAAVGTRDFDDHMTVRMGMCGNRTVDIEEDHTAKAALDLYSALFRKDDV
jgi:hypothetical protein